MKSNMKFYNFFEAMKIHISETTKELLDHYGGFDMEKRGSIEIKV